MSDNLDPISPSEATQILSNSRWNRDESSEDFLTGKRGVEASQGFSEMPLANPITKEADEPIDSADLRPLREEAQEIPAPTPINYHQQGGEHAGQPMDDRLTVSAEQAAADIARYREGVGEQIEALEAQQIRETIDALRAGDQQQPQAPAEPVALDKQIPAAPEAQAQPVAEDPVAKALQDPAVLAAVQAEVQRHGAAAEQAIGISEVVRRFLHEKSPDRHVTFMTIDDVKHFSDEEKQRIIASYPKHELEARTKGIPILGSGRIFPVEEVKIACEHRDFPSHWPRIGGMDFAGCRSRPFGNIKIAML